MDKEVTFLSAVGDYVGSGNMSLRCVASSVSLRVSLRSGDSRLSSSTSLRTCVKTMLFTIETTADHHQVPRVRMKRVPGTIKTETGTGQENGHLVCTGYRNIIGAPQAYAIWGKIYLGDPALLKTIYFVVFCVRRFRKH